MYKDSDFYDVYGEDYHPHLYKTFYEINIYVYDFKGDIVHPPYDEYTIVYDNLKSLKGCLNKLRREEPFDTLPMKAAGFKIYTYTDSILKDFKLLIDTINPKHKHEDIFDKMVKAQHKFKDNKRGIDKF